MQLLNKKLPKLPVPPTLIRVSMETAKEKIAFLTPDTLYVYMIILQPFLGKRRKKKGESRVGGVQRSKE